MFLSIVIPVFNEQDNVRPLCYSIVDQMNMLNKDYEIIFVSGRLVIFLVAQGKRAFPTCAGSL